VQHTITNFDPNLDTINLQRFGKTVISAADQIANHTTQIRHDTLISIGSNDSILLKNVQVARQRFPRARLTQVADAAFLTLRSREWARGGAILRHKGLGRPAPRGVDTGAPPRYPPDNHAEPRSAHPAVDLDV
jgi:hypothetical protein